ncbi:MAG TPA: hypothetical protein EYG11_20590 [Candidatus Latescibacteria bacterium]|nr:hypothetical protein [Candidatus Handelsmanbacteria bacterium]HIL11102.1 hypothetical protein [Candidatus Latescibacterota bacterium]
MAAFFIFGGLGLDLFIAPLLLWSRTRFGAFAVSLTFHLLNNWIFRRGQTPRCSRHHFQPFLDPLLSTPV